MKIRQIFCKHEFDSRNLVCGAGKINTRFANKCVKCGYEFSVKIPNEALYKAIEKILDEAANDNVAV